LRRNQAFRWPHSTTSAKPSHGPPVSTKAASSIANQRKKDDRLRQVVKRSNREKLLETGLRVMHQHGFTSASVRDIVEAAGVPQGSFTNLFPSKEAFCLEILNLYHAGAWKTIQETLRNEAIPPLARLDAYIDAHARFLKIAGAQNGCLYGNVTAELNEHSENVRRRLAEIFLEIQKAVAECLKAAVKEGQLPPKFKCNETAEFVVSSMQGAMLLGRSQRNLTPLRHFKEVLFSKVLRD
jgi:TetR/AcrR family transcriptional regulator, transcriptional repressor for nem operon